MLICHRRLLEMFFWAGDIACHEKCPEWWTFHKFQCWKSTLTLTHYDQGVSEGYCAMSYIISNPHSRTIWSSKGFRIHPHTAEKTTRFLFRGTFGHTVLGASNKWCQLNFLDFGFLTHSPLAVPNSSNPLFLVRIKPIPLTIDIICEWPLKNSMKIS